MKKLLFVVLAVFCALPVYAGVEFSSGEFKAIVHGEMYADGFYTYGSETYSSTGASGFMVGNGQHSFGSMAFVGSSKIGVTMKFKNISGTFEAGLGDIVRRFFLKYNFGGKDDHYLLIGRENNLGYYLFGQVSNDGQSLIDYGNVTNRRRLQVRYGIKGFEIAAIIPKIGLNSLSDDAAYQDTSADGTRPGDYIFPAMPRLEVAYTLNADTTTVKFYGSYGAYWYKNKNATATTESFDKTAHMFTVGFGGSTFVGPGFIHFAGHFGQNMYLNSTLGGYYSATTVANNRLNPVSMVAGASGLQTIRVSDVYSAGAAIGFGHNFLDGKVVPQIGLGYNANFGPGFQRVDDTLGAYINTQVYVNSWFSIIPEVVLLHDLGGMTTTNDVSTVNNNQGFAIVAGIMAVLSF